MLDLTSYEDDYVLIRDGIAYPKLPTPPFYETVINTRWPLFADARLQAYRSVRSKIELAVLSKTGLYISGGLGVGKTHLLVAAYRYVAEQGYHPILTSVMAMIDDIKAEIETKETYMVPHFQEAEWLFLDDMGSGLLTRYIADRLLAILTYRHDVQLPTFVTSNFGLNALANGLNKDGNVDGDRIASRLRGMCAVLELKGPDRRQKP